ESAAAGLLMSAIRAVTGEGRVLTPDLGGQATTVAVGDAIIRKMQAAG
ncbi:MAG: tartrate dehydrogenase, partial [Chloroflexi bacterium]